MFVCLDYPVLSQPSTSYATNVAWQDHSEHMINSVDVISSDLPFTDLPA